MALTFEIGLRLSDKELKSQLSSIGDDLSRAFTVKNTDGSFSKEIAAAATQAKALDKALKAATTDKGISYAQLNLELAKAGTTAGKLTSTLAQGGTYFRQSLDAANNALALSNRHVLSLNKTLQEAGRVFKQSFKFTVAQTAIRAISSEIRESVQWVTNLNDAVNDIAVVTGKTANQVSQVTTQAVQGSKELRIAAEDYAKGALIFYQQGLNDDEVIRRNEITIKAAKAANQSIDDMSKQLTAIWNTYGMVGQEQMIAASVGAKMAASTAVDFADIAQAMQSAAAPAAQMGVEYNQLAAIIATVGDTTQQSASVIGNAYKTIFSRFQQLVSDGTDGEVTLGAVSSKLQNLGIQLYNADGSLKNLGQTINEVGNNWGKWSQEQQLAIAQLVGGTRQYGQFLALMENFDKYQKNLQLASSETGATLEQQYTQAIDSIESRAENAGEAWHRAFSNVITANEIKTAYGALEDMGTAVDNMIKGVGGLPGILSIVSVLLSSKIVPALQIAGKSALTLGASLIGKQNAMIDRDFGKNAEAIDSNAGLSATDKETALAKNEFSRQTAVINEQINSQLSRATGLRRTELEMQREQLATTQKSFSAVMSEAQALEQKLQRQLEIYNVEEVSVESLELQSQQELENLQVLEEQLNILKQQSEQKNKIKNSSLLSDDYRYEGTQAERRMQNRTYISQAEDKLKAARDDHTNTLVALEAAKENQTEEQSVNKLVSAYGNLQKALANYQKQKMAGKTDQAAASMEQAKKAALELANGLTLIGEKSGMTDKEIAAFKATLGSLDDNIDLTRVSDQLSSIGQEMMNMKSSGENAKQVLSETQSSAVQNAQRLGEATGTIAQLQREQAAAAATAAQYQKATLSEGISLTVQFASAAAMAVNSIKNMWDIYNNPDLSGGEKALQMITAMSSTLMFSLPTFTAVIKKVQEFGRASIQATVTQNALSAATAAAGTAGVTSAVSQAAAEKGLAAAKQATGIAALKAGLMAQTAWGPLLPVIIAITAAVAALVATFAFLASEAANNSAEGQLKKAEEAAEKLAEAENEAKQRAEDLRSAIAGYDEAIETLNKCTKGTKEWEEALVEVNAQITSILRQFPELLKQQDLFNKDGTLNKDVLERAQQEADNIATAASAASLRGQVDVYNKRANVATSQMASKYEDYTDYGAYNTGHKDLSFSTVNNDLQKVLQSYDNVGSKALELGDIYAILGDITDDYAEDVLKLAQSHVDAAQMMENANKLIITEWATNNGEELAEGQAELMASAQQEYYDTFAEAFKKASNQNMKAHNVDHSTLGAAFNGTSFEGMSVTEAFNAARGTSYSLAGNGVRGTDSNRSYVYLEDGVEKEYKMEEMQATVAAAAALEKMGESADNAANILNTLKTNAGEAVGAGLQSYLTTGNLESMNKNDFESLQTGISGAGGAAEYLQQVFGKTNEELIALLGEDYANDLQTAVDNYAIAFDSFKSGLYDIVQKGYDSLDNDKDNLSVDGQKVIAQTMQDAFVNGGKEGLKDVQEVFDSLDETNIQDFTDLVGNMDWSISGAEEFTQALEAAGIETDLTAEQIQRFASVMSREDLSQEFSKLTDSYSELHKIIDGLSVGDTISAEDYNKLSDPMKEYFTMMEDGTYALVKSAEDLKSLLSGTEQRERLGNIGKLKDTMITTSTRSASGQSLVDKYGTDSALDEETNTYSVDVVRGQLDLITLYQDQLGIADETLKEWYADLDDGSGHFESGAAGLAQIAAYAQQAAEAIENDNLALQNNQALMQSMQEAFLGTAQNVYELDALYKELQIEMGEMGASANAYNEALIVMASQYDNTAQEITALQEAMAAVEFDNAGNITAESQAMVDAAQKALKAATLIGEAANKYGLDAKVLETQAKALAKAYGLDEEAAARLAVANQRMNKGISTLNSNFKGWKKTLQSTEKTSQDYAEAVVGITEAVSDLIGAEEGFELPEGFLDSAANLELLEQAANGSESAINQIGNIMAQAQVSAWEFNDALVAAAIASGDLDSGFDATKFESYKTTVMDGLENLKSKMGELEDGADVGDILGENWVESLNQMAIATGMSVEEMNGLLNKMGVQAEVTTTSVPQTMEVPTYTEVVEPQPVTRSDGEGGTVTKYSWKHYTIPGKPETVEGYTQVAQIKAEGNDSVGSSPKLTWTGTSGRSAAGHSPKASTGGGSNKGGGSSKTPEHKAKKAENRTELDDRYSTIKSKIDDVARALEDYSNAEDDAFGAAKLAAMQKQEKSLVQQAKHYKTLREMALNYLKLDQKEASSGKNRTDLKAKLAELGLDNNLIDVQYDDDGFVANRTEVIQQLDALLESKYNTYKAAADAYDANKSTDEAESERIDGLKDEYTDLDKLVQAFLEDLDQVDETAKEAREALLAELEKIREWMQKKVDYANYKLELRVGINEMDIKMMELTIRLWDKLGVKMGSTFNNLHKNLTSSADSLQGMVENSNRMWEILNNISPSSEHQSWFEGQFGKEAWQEYINGNGALPTVVIENLEEKADEMLSTLSGMYDTAEEMLGQFVEAMNMFLEDFDKIADKLTRQNEKLDMFEELLDFSGKKYSVEGREAMLGILQARMDNAKVAVANAKAEQEFTKVAVDEARASLEQFFTQEGRDVSAYDDTAAFFYNQLKNSLDEAEAAAAEAESKFYSSMQELTAAARAAIEESARIIEEELVDSLGGIFDSFDSGLDMYQHQDDMYNFFLDDYDKGYELKKLLGEIEDAMEDVTDPERLAEWGALIDDINAASEDGVKITQTDLDILKARFDLQKAYDEYSDARAGKNTMRLQRDASGNYSYVYSDDGNSAESDGQQKIEDALHNIHKMHREAADEMQSMWFQTYVEMEKYLAQVDQLRLQNDAEYAAEVQWYKDMYQQKLEHYRDQTIQHNAAIDRSYEDTTLGVITGMKDMEGTHDWYMQQAVKYDEKLKASALSWENQVRETCNQNGINYDTLESDVKTETDLMIQENEALRKKIEQLKTDGTRALQSLGGQIRSFVSQGVSQMRQMKQAVEELIQKLQELKRLQLAEANRKELGYDKGTDYTNYLITDWYNYTQAGGKLSEREWLEQYHYNDVLERTNAGDDRGIDAGHDFDSAASILEQAMKDALADPPDWMVNGELFNYKGVTSNKEFNDWQLEGNDVISVGKIPKAATGGLFEAPNITEISEEGPELVLNPEDTANILRAVQAVRQTVQAQMSAATAAQFTKLQESTKQVDYGRYELDDAYKAYVDAAIAGQEQKVQIEAHFPGVTAASEIEDAFNQLVTQAAQYRIRSDR